MCFSKRLLKARTRTEISAAECRPANRSKRPKRRKDDRKRLGSSERARKKRDEKTKKKKKISPREATKRTSGTRKGLRTYHRGLLVRSTRERGEHRIRTLRTQKLKRRSKGSRGYRRGFGARRRGVHDKRSQGRRAAGKIQPLKTEKLQSQRDCEKVVS